MQNATPKGGAVLQASERLRSTTRALIRATPTMALRLESIKRGAWWAR